MAAPVASSFERDPGDSLPARDRGPKGRADAPSPSFERAPGNSLPARDRGPKGRADRGSSANRVGVRRAAPSPKDEPCPGIT